MTPGRAFAIANVYGHVRDRPATISRSVGIAVARRSVRNPGRVGRGIAATINALRGGPGGTPVEVDAYFEGVARARYIIRRTFRIFDEVARNSDLEPLQHQALIQILGGGVTEGALPVSRIAERLNVTSAFASRLVQDLEAKELVVRRPSEVDRRVILVEATAHGRRCLTTVSDGVRRDVAYFQSHLTEEDRAAALTVMAFYVGVPLNDDDLESIRSLVQSAIHAQREAAAR